LLLLLLLLPLLLLCRGCCRFCCCRSCYSPKELDERSPSVGYRRRRRDP
jgi:hypothetical protein